MKTDEPKAIYLKDYAPYPYMVSHVDLTFRIGEDETFVVSKVAYKKRSGTTEDLYLNGEHLKLEEIHFNGARLNDYFLDEKSIVIPCPAAEDFTLEIVTRINPEQNTRLEGLYKSGGNWCTQCEAEGFRGITYFPDRPDVMATFRVRIEADEKTCPVLLSNGNLHERSKLVGGWHFAVWDDPFPKPCYLFALVAGDLVHIEDRFTTKSGLDVALRIYVRAGDEGQCGYAMDSLKRAMKWDEDVYGREYQYRQFTIVAISDFNMAGMENTSLNIFNTAVILSQPETATDTDYDHIDAVVSHEYFHNWSGNRVTCRDWFQICLKEGFTVFREQQFTALRKSETIERIDDVSYLRRMQFPEDAGPLAHPIRPDNYIEINNFYTLTVYEKGSEVIRMLQTLLGDDAYRRATDLYFARFDGMAVTTDDFVQCMADVSGRDMTQFKRWYSQAGTPEVTAHGHYDAQARSYTLELAQTVPATPGQPVKEPMLIPVRVGLVGPNGHDMAERLCELTETTQSFVFDNIPSPPVPSILRGFSAPVKLKTDLGPEELRFLMVHDGDGFNRWEAGQSFALQMMQDMLDNAATVWPDFLDSVAALLTQAEKPDADKALLARALALPDLGFIGQQRAVVDPAAIHAARQAVIRAIAARFGKRLHALYAANNDDVFADDFSARARRAFKNFILRVLEDPALAVAQYRKATNMTDRIAALAVLADLDTAARGEAFADFAARFAAYPLVIDKWFALQASAIRPSAAQDVAALKIHAGFTMKNPNRVRALYSAFGLGNPVCFHGKDGAGYRFVADGVIELNAINPQVAARLLMPFRDWRRYAPAAQEQMKAEMQRIAATPDLSADVFEIVSKSLAA